MVALTPLVNMLAIDGEFLSCSVDAGFVLALPLHHRDLELDSIGVLTKSYLKIMLLFLVACPYIIMSKIKIPVQELWPKMWRGLYAKGVGAYGTSRWTQLESKVSKK